MAAEGQAKTAAHRALGSEVHVWRLRFNFNIWPSQPARHNLALANPSSVNVIEKVPGTLLRYCIRRNNGYPCLSRFSVFPIAPPGWRGVVRHTAIRS